jgi:Outer membrane protein beta-barrel domain
MRKMIILVLFVIPFCSFSQIGLKAGLNFANVTNQSSINNSSRSGFMAGVFISPSPKKIISSLTEVIYSKQGYDYKTGTKTGKVNLDYILIPQLMGINITKFVQLQFGAQMAFLINAKADSTNNGGTAGPYGSILNYYNKFDYGFAAGAEIHPVKGLLIGARYNISLGKIYKDAQSGQLPSFAGIGAKNNVVQIFAGWIFGRQSSSHKKNKQPEK